MTCTVAIGSDSEFGNARSHRHATAGHDKGFSLPRTLVTAFKLNRDVNVNVLRYSWPTIYCIIFYSNQTDSNKIMYENMAEWR